MFALLQSFGIGSRRCRLDTTKLAAPSELPYLPPIEYAYDPLASCHSIPSQPLRPLVSGATQKSRLLVLNSVQLHPREAGLPYRSSIDHIFASKHWESILAETKGLLELLAGDDSGSDMVVEHGITLAKLAKGALQPGLGRQMALATQYMFPYAGEHQIKQISALMILYFVFDGMFTVCSLSA